MPPGIAVGQAALFEVRRWRRWLVRRSGGGESGACGRRKRAATAPGQNARRTASRWLNCGRTTIPFYSSTDLSKSHPEIKRALIVLHGRLRDADRLL